MRKELGKYFVDISKLVFGGVVLSQILGVSENKTLIILLGLLAAALFAFIGFRVLKHLKN